MSGIIYDKDALAVLALEAHATFEAAGYTAGLGKPPQLNPPVLDKQGMGSHTLVHAEFGGGGFRDVVIEFRDWGFCRFYVGPLYEIFEGGDRRDIEPPVCQFWGGFTMPREGHQTILLEKVRKVVLADEGMGLPSFD